jgi:hypothetical protein
VKKPVASQREKFIEAARDLGTDDSEAAFDRALRKIGTAPPAPMHKPKKQPRRGTKKR